jgi:hypothetical protein
VIYLDFFLSAEVAILVNTKQYFVFFGIAENKCLTGVVQLASLLRVVNHLSVYEANQRIAQSCNDAVIGVLKIGPLNSGGFTLGLGAQAPQMSTRAPKFSGVELPLPLKLTTGSLFIYLI